MASDDLGNDLKMYSIREEARRNEALAVRRTAWLFVDAKILGLKQTELSPEECEHQILPQ